MDFKLTDEQIMFRDMAKDFAIREILPSVRDRDREDRFFPEIIEKLGEQGLLGAAVPEEYGGLGLSWLTFGMIIEQIAEYDASVALNLLIASTLQALPIVQFGTEEQKKKYLPGIINGTSIGALGAVEPDTGSDSVAIETTAVLDGDEWVINGNKTWITNATVCDFAIIMAQTDKSKGYKGITTFIVDRDTPGFTTMKIEHKLGLHTGDTGQLFFRDCRIPKANLLGVVGRGTTVALGSIENTRYGISCCSIGVMQACIDACVKYCLDRKQFGKPIGSFQLVQEKIATMVVDCEASRLLSYHVGYLKDNELPHSKETSIAKLHNTERASKASKTAVEIHGAYGFTDDFPLERLYRDTIAYLIFGGSSHVHSMLIGRAELGIDAISR